MTGLVSSNVTVHVVLLWVVVVVVVFKSGAEVIHKNRCRLDLTKINGEGTTI